MEFIRCDKCGKKLIVKRDDGKFHFIFGKRYGGNSPVDIIIDGNIEIKCIKNGCNNIINIGE